MSLLRGFEPQAVSPIKVIPAGWRVSCAPLSTYLYSRPEKRGTVKIAHGELCEMIISGRLL